MLGIPRYTHDADALKVFDPSSKPMLRFQVLDKFVSKTPGGSKIWRSNIQMSVAQIFALHEKSPKSKKQAMVSLRRYFHVATELRTALKLQTIAGVLVRWRI